MRISVALVTCVLSSLASAAAEPALAAVNVARAKRGLPPYLEDPGLTIGAMRAADFRAAHHLFGHTSNDFGFLPPGTHASAAGCAGNGPSWGFMACDMYANYTHAGAAWVMGTDGNLYCHLFVRGGTSSVTTRPSSGFTAPARRGFRR